VPFKISEINGCSSEELVSVKVYGRIDLGLKNSDYVQTKMVTSITLPRDEIRNETTKFKSKSATTSN
jgi:hypothetical protein